MRLILLIPILFSVNCFGQPYKWHDITIKVKLYVNEVFVDKTFHDLLINSQKPEEIFDDTTSYLIIKEIVPYIPLATLFISYKSETMKVTSQELTLDSLVFAPGQFVFTNQFDIDGRNRLIKESLYYDLIFGTNQSIEMDSINYHLGWLDLNGKYNWLPDSDSLKTEMAFSYIQKYLRKTKLQFWTVYPKFNDQSAKPDKKFYIRIAQRDLELARKLGFTRNNR